MSTRAAAAVLPLPTPSSAAAALPNPAHPPLRCRCQRPCTADAALPTPLRCVAALPLPCAAINFRTSAQPQMCYCRCAANTCVNWPFSRTHLPVTLTNFSYRPFFGIHMEVLDAELEQIQNRFTICHCYIVKIDFVLAKIAVTYEYSGNRDTVVVLKPRYLQ